MAAEIQSLKAADQDPVHKPLAVADVLIFVIFIWEHFYFAIKWSSLDDTFIKKFFDNTDMFFSFTTVINSFVRIRTPNQISPKLFLLMPSKCSVPRVFLMIWQNKLDVNFSSSFAPGNWPTSTHSWRTLPSSSNLPLVPAKSLKISPSSFNF